MNITKRIRKQNVIEGCHCQSRINLQNIPGMLCNKGGDPITGTVRLAVNMFDIYRSAPMQEPLDVTKEHVLGCESRLPLDPTDDHG